MLAPLLTVLALATAGPTNAVAPSVHGTARVGSTLTASPGSWSSSGTITYGYQWLRCDANGSACATIAGASSGVYKPAAADAGKTLAVTVTATDPAGKTTLDSPLLGPVAAAGALATTAQPVVSGTTKLTVTKGSWTTAPAAVTYAWLRCDRSGRTCTAIQGAAAATYTAAADDGGHRLVARLQATAGSARQTALSLPSAVLGSGTTTTTTTTPTPGAPPAYPRPEVTGTAAVGQQLTAAPPAGLPTGTTVAFQWYRCDGTGARCLSIHGATARTYREVAKDGGMTLATTAKVTAGGTTTSVYSSLIGPVAMPAAPAVSTTQPKVTGQALQGQTLTASAGTWSKTPTTTNYAWQRCNANGRICLTIEGATQSTYVPTAADVGHAIASLVVVTIGSETSTATVFSTATDAVKPSGLVNTAPPAVTGTLRVGQKLSATAGTWTGAQPIAYHYQWYRCDASGAHCLSVHGATGATYTLVAKDTGQTVGLTVTASDATEKKPAYASLAGPIAAASASLVSTARPQLTGTAPVGQTLTADAGSWSTTPSATAFQWLRCNQNGRICTPVAGATSASFAITAADSGHTLVAQVTATAGGESAKTLSLASAPVS